MRKGLVDEAYFLSRVKPGPNGCVLWAKGTDSCGYGRVSRDGEVLAHRVAHLLFIGPIPDSLHVLHRCDNPPCVNPEHLFLGTHQDNMDDRGRKGRSRHGTLPGLEAPAAKLDEDALDAIRSCVAPARELAAYFGVHQVTIDRVKRGATYGSHQGI